MARATYVLNGEEFSEMFADYRAVLASRELWEAWDIKAVEGGVERDGTEDIAHFWLRENNPEREVIPPALEQAIEAELYQDELAETIRMRGVA